MVKTLQTQEIRRANGLNKYLYNVATITSLHKEQWMWDKLIYRNTIVLLDGMGGTGKSRLAVQIGACLLLQRDFLDIPEFPYRPTGTMERVLYFTAEDPVQIVDNRIYEIWQGMGKGSLIETAKQRFFILNFYEASKDFVSSTIINQQGEPTKTYRDILEIVREIRPTLIVFDSLINFFGGNENDSAIGRNFYQLLLNLDSTILLLHHQNKASQNGEGNANTAARGTTVFREQARTRLILRKNELIINKMNYSNTSGTIITLHFENGIFKPIAIAKEETVTVVKKDRKEEEPVIKQRGRPRRGVNYESME